MALQLQLCALTGKTFTLSASCTETAASLKERLRRAAGDVSAPFDQGVGAVR